MARRRRSARGRKLALRSRNPLALATRRLGRRVKPSAKVYRRKPRRRGTPENGGDQ